MRFFLPILKQYKKQFIIGPFFKMLEAVFELIMPVIMAVLIDRGIRDNNLPLVLRSGGFMLLLAAAGLGSAFVCQYYASIASQGFGTRLRDRLFAHICGLSYGELDRFSAASLSNRLTGDVGQLQLAVAMTIRLAIRAPLLCVGGVIATMFIDFKLSLIVLASLPVFTGALYLILRLSAKLFRLVQIRLDALSAAVGENLEGVRVIRAFARTDAQERRFDGLNRSHSRALKAALFVSSLSNPVTGLIINLALVGIIGFGGVRVNAGEMTQGEIIAFISYMSQILLALGVTANLLGLYTRAAASATRVREILEISPAVVSPEKPRKMPDTPPAIEFCHVEFSYGGEEPVLSDIHFRAEPGEIVGIIGATGSGKTSLIQLIPRFYDVTAGQILLGGTDIRELSLDDLRRRTSLVSQKTQLFSGTVLSNLQMGDEDITEEAARQAAKTAQALDFIENMGGLFASVERGGTNLSGGQRQRLSIARALAKRPSILILDDCTSALDYATEARLWRALREWGQPMTTLIVSQRVSALRRANRILVLSEGKMAGFGTHEELYQTCEVYRGICETEEQN